MNATVILCVSSLLLFGCSDSKKESVAIAKETRDEVLMLDNPSLFMGSNFAEFIQMNHKLGNYQIMLQFTFKETRERFTAPELIDFFKNMQFSYPLHLISKNEENGLITLFYRTTIDATERTIQLNVKVENDTCKLVLDVLNPGEPFIGIR
ncbi:MAG: hypothetical protein WC044_01580 [Crocinitomicaceae bacterium]